MPEVTSNTWCQSYTGRRFVPETITAEDIDIRDIVQSLSNQCRFMGHSKYHYSVAQHSVLCSHMVEEHMLGLDSLERAEKIMPLSPASRYWAGHLKRWALLHDAAEAYIGDIPRPMKKRMPWVKEAEDALLQVIAKRFNLCWPMPAVIHDIDNRMLFTEKRDVLNVHTLNWEWAKEPVPFPGVINKITPDAAHALFWERFSLLCGEPSDFYAQGGAHAGIQP